MKLHIKEFAIMTGVSVRTLHYYDEIGLLKPCCVDENNGYRFYNKASLERMQEILYYKELDFPLKSIVEILALPSYDRQKALIDQKRLLILKKERLDRLINAIEQVEKGEIVMDVFENMEFENARSEYETEVKERWGNTEAYKESKEKTANYSKEKWNNTENEMNNIFKEFAACMRNGESADSENPQCLVRSLQNFITQNFYNCTNEILEGLGKMYVCDERFKNNIDKQAVGTAEYISNAIDIFVNSKKP